MTKPTQTLPRRRGRNKWGAHVPWFDNVVRSTLRGRLKTQIVLDPNLHWHRNDVLLGLSPFCILVEAGFEFVGLLRCIPAFGILLKINDITITNTIESKVSKLGSKTLKKNHFLNCIIIP